MAAVLQLGRRVVAASFDAAMAILESGEARFGLQKAHAIQFGFG